MDDFKRMLLEMKENRTPEEEREIEKAIEDEQNALKKEIESNHVIENFGKRYIDCTFENYEVYDDKQNQVIAECKKYIHFPKKKGESLMLIGKCGTGKDHLIVSIAKQLGEYKASNLERLAEKKRAAQNTKIPWQEKLKEFIFTPMLIILDFAIRGQLTDSQKEVLSHIVDERYKRMLPMIISTNLDVKKLKEAVDFPEFPRVTDRFKEIFKGRILLCDWDSYRGRDV